MIAMLSALAAGYALWLLCIRVRGGPAVTRFFDMLFALSFAVGHFVLYPSDVIYDDGGIVVRYMDQFAKGHFYCYNPADGPVFGISGFLHGILAGALSYTHVVSPANSVLASNLAGMVLTAFLLLRIVRTLDVREDLIYPCWILSLLMSRYLLITAKQGLETPLHLAVVLAAILFYLNGNERRFWFFETLMVISKLDALPIAVLLAIGFIARNAAQLFPLSPRNAFVRRACLYSIPLGLLWLLFTFLVFNGPLPQTAVAKLYYFHRPDNSWFPFLQPYIAGSLGVLAAGLVGLLTAHAAVLVAKRQSIRIFRDCILGLAAIAYFILYYFYNPAEQMPWYYTLPDLFLVAQGMVTVFLATGFIVPRWSKAIAIMSLSLYAVAIWPGMSARIRGHGDHFNVIEHERMAIGQWIDRNAGPDDKVMCGHGHIARECRRYVVDYSGLNSTRVTDLKRNMNAIVEAYQPEWIVLHGRLEQNGMTNAGYRIAKSFYNVSSIWASSATRKFVLGETWRIYHRDTNFVGFTDFAIEPERLTSNGKAERSGTVYATGTSITADFSDRPIAIPVLDFGLSHEAARQVVSVQMRDDAGSIAFSTNIAVPALDRVDFISGYTTAVRIDHPSSRAVAQIDFTARAEPSSPFTLLSPIVADIPPAAEGRD